MNENETLKESENNRTANDKGVVSSSLLCAVKAKAKLFIDANVWDGEVLSGNKDACAMFNPDDLQELINDLIEFLHST